MKKLLLLMMSLVMVCALAACGNKDSQPANNNQQVDNPPEVTAGWQAVADLEIDAADAEGATLDIAVFQADPENAVLAECDADVQAKMAAWLNELRDEYVLWVNAYVLDTDDYLNVLLIQDIAPNYGSDGNIYTYVYDKTTNTMMDLDYALAWKTVTDEVVIEALQAYLQPTQKWRSFVYDGFYVDTDGVPVYVVTTTVGQEGTDDWTYAYLLKDGQILGNVSSVMPEGGADEEPAA